MTSSTYLPSGEWFRRAGNETNGGCSFPDMGIDQISEKRNRNATGSGPQPVTDQGCRHCQRILKAELQPVFRKKLSPGV